MQYRIPAALGLLLVLFSCKSADKGAYTINGKIGGLEKGTVVLQYHVGDADSLVIDSVQILGGKFTFKGKVSYPTYALLGLPSVEEQTAMALYLEPGEITISMPSPDSLGVTLAKGGVANTELTQLVNILKKFGEESQRIEAAADAANGDSLVEDSLRKVAEVLDKNRDAGLKAFINTHPASFVAAQEVLEVYDYNPDVAEFAKVYQNMDTTVKASPVGHQVAQMLSLAERTDVGQVPPDFTQNDTEGNPVTLSRYAKGKVCLVDFWASWCGPCRRENPNVLKAYKAFHDKGFDILGVSLDQNKDAWTKAIQDDHLTWTEVSDLKYFSNAAAVEYGIKGIPMNYLIGKDGKIVAKGLRGDDLEKELATLLH